jgi:NitT/TauT family transport system substrate-binding protein
LRRWRNALLSFVAFALVLLGGDRTQPAAAQDQAPVRVALSTFEAHANAYYAQDLGLFARAGLNVQIQQFPGGAAILAGIVAGALDIGAGNPLPLANAREHGFDVVFVAPGTIYDSTLTPVDGMIVAPNSSLHTPKDLEGKTVGVNSLHSLDQIATQAWVDRNGGDAKAVKFVEVPNNVMVDAVADGRVDAAVVGDPGYTTGVTSGRVRRLGDPYTAIAKRFMLTAWFATRAWAAAHPEVVGNFAAATAAASTWAVKNPVAAADVLHKYMRLGSSRANERHARALDPDLLQPLIDVAARYGALPRTIDARELIFTSP